jgi:hypothetical protein
MRQKPTKTLSIFARGKEIGFVILEDGEILKYGAKTVKGKRSRVSFDKRVEKALCPLLKAVRPQGSVALERDLEDSKRGALCRAIGRTSKLWGKKGYPLRFVSLRETKKSLCGKQKATYQELIEEVVRKRPLL